MYYKGNQMVKKLYYGTKEIKAVYIGEKKIYPNIVDQQTGFDHTDWVYNLPDRTRTETPWTQDVYADGSVGEKVLGSPVTKKETASVSEGYEEWTYNIDANTGTRTRVVNNVYTFKDTTKTTFKKNETENGARSQDTWIYDWANSKRTATVTYNFKDATKTATASENGTVTYNFIITPENTNIISARGGSITINNKGSLTRKWNNTSINTTSETVSGIEFSGTSTGFTKSGLTVSATNRGTSLGDARTVQVYGKASVDGKNLNSSTITITQAENQIIIRGNCNFTEPNITLSKASQIYYIKVSSFEIWGQYSSSTSNFSISQFNIQNCTIQGISFNSDNSNWATLTVERYDSIRCDITQNNSNKYRYFQATFAWDITTSYGTVKVIAGRSVDQEG